MKNINKIAISMVFVVIILAGNSIMAAKLKKGKFTIDSYNAVFVHETTSSGTYTSDLNCTGPLKSFTSISGTFTSTPIDQVRAEVVEISRTRVDNLILRTKTTYIADLYQGTITYVKTRVVLKDRDTGEKLIAKDVTSSGSFAPLDFDSLTSTSSGKF
jgi:hypothetical protein